MVETKVCIVGSTVRKDLEEKINNSIEIYEEKGYTVANIKYKTPRKSFGDYSALIIFQRELKDKPYE